MKNHDLYNLALRDKNKYPVVAYGSAGTGKTYGAVKAAYEGVRGKEYERIIVTRPNVSFADKNGFLPGNEKEKMEPWVRPVRQHLENFAGKGEIDSWEKNDKLQFLPLEFIQGLTFDRSFVILDECQNMSIDQIRVFLTRLGEWSKVVLCGDIAQVSPKFRGSGLAELIRMIKHFQIPVHMVEFDRGDIMRSAQCKMWIEAFEEWENNES